MSIYIGEGFFKKKKKFIQNKFTNEEFKTIESLLKKIVQKFNSDPNVKKEIEKEYYENELDQEYGKFKFKRFICEEFEKSDSEISFVVCDENQDYRVAASSAISKMGKELENQIKEKGIDASVSCGDGDEGCVYIKAAGHYE